MLVTLQRNQMIDQPARLAQSFDAVLGDVNGGARL